MHHIVFFSEGGPNTEENLMLVCANCHSAIHADCATYTVEVLQRKKMHWIGMASVVPSELLYPGAVIGDFQVPFLMESLNLRFLITMPPATTVDDLTSFIRQEIIQPLARYDDNATWQTARDVKLSLRSEPTVYLAGEQPIQGISIPADDSLVAVMEMPVLLEIPPIFPMPIEALRRHIRIHHPRQGGVRYREIVRGSVGFPPGRVWVLIRPFKYSQYWVQPPCVFHDGIWSTKAYFGEPWQSGEKFEVIALAGNTEGLREGKILTSLPGGCRLSEAISVWRLG
jgi:hypothetical protein